MFPLITGNLDYAKRFKKKKQKFIMLDKRLRFQKGKQKEFLEKVIWEEFKLLNKFVQFIGFSRRNVFDWRKEKLLLPKNVFERICISFPKYRNFGKFIQEELLSDWGTKKAQKASAPRMEYIQNRMKASVAKRDTVALKKCLELVTKNKKGNKDIVLPTLDYRIKTYPVSLDTSKVAFSRNDLAKGIILPKELSVDLCYVIGAHIGDGCMNIYKRPGQISYYYSCCGHLINDRKWYDSVLIPLKKKLFNLELNTKLYNNGCCAIQFRSKAIIGFYSKCIGLPPGKKSGLIDIPNIILDAGLPYALACISGIFDTDFYLGFKNKNNTVHTYPFIELIVKSARLVKTISKILKQSGFSYSTRDCTKFDKRFGKTIELYPVKTSGRANVIRWFKLIGSRNPNYLSKFLIWKNFGFCPPNLNYYQRKEILEGRVNPLKFYSAPDRI